MMLAKDGEVALSFQHLLGLSRSFYGGSWRPSGRSHDRGHKIERLKWSLWHGQVDKALGKIDDLETSIEPFAETYTRFPRLVKALAELRTYIVNNRHLMPNYGERYHHGEAIATGCVESTVNEVVSR